MIEVSPETACMLYVGGLLGLLIFAWIRHSLVTKNREIIVAKSRHHSCEFCSHSYLIDSLTAYHRCPQCKCLNQFRCKK
jgi:hypothetical protein